jgi:hypothetical protein
MVTQNSVRLTEQKVPVLQDVARAAGVSVPTVSRVLTSSKYVAPELRERVLKTVSDLGYRPNGAAPYREGCTPIRQVRHHRRGGIRCGCLARRTRRRNGRHPPPSFPGTPHCSPRSGAHHGKAVRPDRGVEGSFDGSRGTDSEGARYLGTCQRIPRALGIRRGKRWGTSPVYGEAWTHHPRFHGRRGACWRWE